MEKASSTRATSNPSINNMAPFGGPMFAPDSASGRKSTSTEAVIVDASLEAVEVTTASPPPTMANLIAMEEESSESEWDSEEEELSEEEDDDSDDEEEDEEWNERLRVLEDARNLRKVAGFFLHPEAPVVTEDATASARCYFSRASAPEKETFGAAEERSRVLEEAKQLKKQAVDFMHPEVPVVTGDSAACGRNYFSRPSAPSYEDEDEMEDRDMILKDMVQLKRMAVDYLHPERPVEADACVSARCFFDRASAPEKETFGAAEERARILEEAKQLKSQAVLYAHPERPLEVDGTATARCYFDRPSAPEQETFGASEERARVLEEATLLKKQADIYAHPGRPVAVDGSSTARCFFDRPSSPEQETFGSSEERARVLAEAKALKAQATLYAHPERPLEVDATATARNFFSRPSAPEQETFGAAEERARVLSEAKALKAQSEMYAHPERPLVVDGSASARCYFDRPSAPEQESFGAAEERARVLAETKALMKQSELYAHPERPVAVEDPAAFGRNFFSRPSAPEQEAQDEAEEHALILADIKALKSQAVDYLHPERPVVADGTAMARCYFSRPSAPQQEDPEEAQERARILAEAVSLKKLAVDYMHPERPVVSNDSMATGRNYFDRASAHVHDQMVHTFPVHEDDLHHDEHHDEHQWDHFGMDEDMDHMFDDMRHDLSLPTGDDRAAKPNNLVNKSAEGSDEEGKLSRSPSSVMLFTGEPVN